MSEWKRTWKKNKKDDIVDDVATKMKKKMKNLRKKIENPRNIVEFENIYEPPQPSNIIEGMENKNEGSTEDAPAGEDGTLEDIKGKVQDSTKRWSEALDPTNVTKIKDPITGLENKLEGAMTGLGNLGDLDATFDSIGDGITGAGEGIVSGVEGTASTFKNVFDFDQKSIQGSINTAGSSVESVTSVIKNTINIFGQKLTVLRLSIQLFMLKANRYVTKTITRMANALTQDTATQQEIDIFPRSSPKIYHLIISVVFCL